MLRGVASRVVIFNDVNEWHRVTDRGAYERAGRPMIEIRACSASGGTMRHDRAFVEHRDRFRGFPRLYYQYPYAQWSAETQADYLADQLGAIDPATEMVMLDIESGSGIADPAGFTRRWLVRAEPRLGTRAWVYVPKALASPALYEAIGDRVVKAPRYSGTAERGPAPDWGRWDVHQYTDRGPMPGSPDGPGDVNWTASSADQLLARCRASLADDPRRRRQALLLV